VLSCWTAHPNTHTESTWEHQRKAPRRATKRWLVHSLSNYIHRVARGRTSKRPAKYSAGHLKLRFSEWPSSCWCATHKGLLPRWIYAAERDKRELCRRERRMTIRPQHRADLSPWWQPTASWIFTTNFWARNINLCQKESDRLLGYAAPLHKQCGKICIWFIWKVCSQEKKILKMKKYTEKTLKFKINVSK
jgi:hypothetical protein